MVDLVDNLARIEQSTSKLLQNFGGVKLSIDEILEDVLADMSIIAKQVLVEEVIKATNLVPEFKNDKILRENLINAVRQLPPDWLIFQRGGITVSEVRRALTLYLGGETELWEGIRAAKRQVTDGSLGKDEAYKFWKWRIYKPGVEGEAPSYAFQVKRGNNKKPFDYLKYGKIKYRETWNVRFGEFGGKAPYWIWLEYGYAGGYPSYPGTYFVARSVASINSAYQQALIELVEGLGEVISEEVIDFLQNPENYTPGDLLGKIETERQQVTFRVTEKLGIIGFRRE